MVTAPWAGYVHFRVSHFAPHGQVVVLRVKDPDGDVTHGQRFGEFEAEADVAKDETFKSKFKNYKLSSHIFDYISFSG